jgi:hypothetical protein
MMAVGSVSPDLFQKHKRLRAYSPEDYSTVLRILEPYDPVLVCPHVLAETSNIVRLTNETHATIFGDALAALAMLFTERHLTLTHAATRPEYGRLGLTDAVLLTLAAEGACLVSDDLDLYLAAAYAGYEAINFSHVREALL